MEHKKVNVGQKIVLTSTTPAVRRVGYRLIWKEIEVRDYDYQDLKDIRSLASKTVSARQFSLIDEALRREIVERERFGGRERMIIRHVGSDLEPGVYRVIEKKRKILGTYVPGWYVPDNAFGPEDHEPASLSNQKPVDILTIRRVNDRLMFSNEGEIASTDDFEILL